MGSCLDQGRESGTSSRQLWLPDKRGEPSGQSHHLRGGRGCPGNARSFRKRAPKGRKPLLPRHLKLSKIPALETEPTVASHFPRIHSAAKKCPRAHPGPPNSVPATRGRAGRGRETRGGEREERQGLRAAPKARRVSGRHCERPRGVTEGRSWPAAPLLT